MIISQNETIFLPAPLAPSYHAQSFAITKDIYNQLGAVDRSGFGEELISQNIPGIKQASFYFEGGNLLRAVNIKGQVVYLCGAQNIFASMLNPSFTFADPSIKQLILDEAEKIDESKEFDTTISNLSRLLTLVDFPAPGKIVESFFRTVESELTKEFYLDEFSESEQQFLVKVFLIMEKVIINQMEKALGAPVIVLGNIFKAQPAFHIDLILAPAPGGKIFIQDDRKSLEILERLESHTTLSQEEKCRLEEY